MNPAIRRLALDLTPGAWAYMLFMYAMGLLMDVFWLNRPQGAQAPLMVGFLLSLSAVYSAQKVAFWRTLPVSQRQIDLARWVQSILAPFLGLAVMMTATALVMAGRGSLHATVPEIILMTAAQAGAGGFIFGGQVALPLLAKRIGAWSMVPWFLVVTLIVYGRRLPVQLPVLPSIAGIGFASAILLFATAGRWPTPLTTSLWNTHGSTSPFRAKRMEDRGGSLSKGWLALVLAQMPLVLLCWCTIPAIPILMRFVLHIRDADVSIMSNLSLLGAGLIPAMAFTTAMRGLRMLPLTGLALTLRVVGTLIAIQLTGAVLYVATVTWFEAGHPPLAGLALLPVAMPALIFALSLRFGPRVGQYGVAFSIMLTQLGAFLFWRVPVTDIEIAALVALLTGLGFAFALREIVSGRHAYRAQPLVPLSWRGR